MILVIGRNSGYSVYIGDDIKITVVLPEDECCVFRIEAPR
ncbi:carbon storage regulator [Bacillus sp. SD075]|nr:carbon storage regulator [Bacillus sp. SD075]MBO0996422.1 carbon storage regulator [Bacillus sp. SD075]